MRLLANVAVLFVLAASLVTPASAGTYQQPPFLGIATVQQGEANAQVGSAVFKKGTTCVVAGVAEAPTWVLEIYDRNGRRVANDGMDDAYKMCIWRPKYTGLFYIKVVNGHPGPQQILCFSN